MKKIFSRKVIYGLDTELSKRVQYADLRKTLEEVINANNDTTAPSTSAVVELKGDLEGKINDVDSKISALIDDSATDATDKTWSINKIKEFVASVDDTVVVGTIADRDGLQAYDSLICYVLDTSDDNSLPDDVKGKPVAYIYANGEWKVLSALETEIDTSVFVKYSDIVNDLTSGGADKPLSAEMGKEIAGNVIPQAINDAKTELVTETGLEINADKITLKANPVGALIFNCVEIATNEGVEVVTATISGDKEVTIQSDNPGEYDGKTATVSYLAYSKDLA